MRGFGSSLDFVFPSFGNCEMLFERTFTVKIAPLHLRVFDESTSFNLLSRQLHISFRDFNSMLKNRIGTFFFNRSSTTCEVVCQLRCVVTVGSRIFINRLIPTLLEISGMFFNFECFFLLVFFVWFEMCLCSRITFISLCAHM